MPASRRPFSRRGTSALLALMLSLLLAAPLAAQNFSDAKKRVASGDYEGALKICEEATREYDPNEEWRLLEISTLMELGRYPDALRALNQGMARRPYSIRILLMGYDVC